MLLSLNMNVIERQGETLLVEPVYSQKCKMGKTKKSLSSKENRSQEGRYITDSAEITPATESTT